MTIQDHHKALVHRHRDVDPLLTAVLERGERMHRRRRHLASAAVAVVIVAALGIGIASAQSAPQTRVTTAAGTSQPTPSSGSTAVGPPGAARMVRLQASDWQTSFRNGTRSMAAGARYTVTSVEGQVLEHGTFDKFGEAIFSVRAASITLSVDQCNYEGPVNWLEPGVTNTVGFPCGVDENVLPSRSIPVTTGNPMDEELRAAQQEAMRCIEAAGLTVSYVGLTIDASGVARGVMQVGLGDSGMTFDESDAVENKCREHYDSLMAARGRWLDEHGG